jgi:CHAT domain-containing protein
VLLGERATEEAFRSRPLAEYDVLHFATHGLVSEDIAGLADSALLLTPGEPNDPYNDGLLTASEIAKFSINARLVILSACNSAKYDANQATLGIHDLQTAFTVAGRDIDGKLVKAVVQSVAPEQTKRSGLTLRALTLKADEVEA